MWYYDISCVDVTNKQIILKVDDISYVDVTNVQITLSDNFY